MEHAMWLAVPICTESSDAFRAFSSNVHKSVHEIYRNCTVARYSRKSSVPRVPLFPSSSPSAAIPTIYSLRAFFSYLPITMIFSCVRLTVSNVFFHNFFPVFIHRLCMEHVHLVPYAAASFYFNRLKPEKRVIIEAAQNIILLLLL